MGVRSRRGGTARRAAGLGALHFRRLARPRAASNSNPASPRAQLSFWPDAGCRMPVSGIRHPVFGPVLSVAVGGRRRKLPPARDFRLASAARLATLRAGERQHTGPNAVCELLSHTPRLRRLAGRCGEGERRSGQGHHLPEPHPRRPLWHRAGAEGMAAGLARDGPGEGRRFQPPSGSRGLPSANAGKRRQIAYGRNLRRLPELPHP